MWDLVIESGIFALVFGFVVSITEIIIKNIYDRRNRVQENKYILYKEIYQKLVSTYEAIYENGGVEEIEKKDSVVDYLNESLAKVFSDEKRNLNTLHNLYLRIRYLLSDNDIKGLELKFESAEKITSLIGNTIFFYEMKDKKDFERLNIQETVDINEFDEYMQKFIDEVKDIKKTFLEIIERELIKLLK